MKKIIFTLLVIFIVLNNLLSQDYFDQNNVQTVILNTGSMQNGNVYFGLEEISTEFIDIAVTYWKDASKYGQWNPNNGNGTFGNISNFTPVNSGEFRGNVFIKLRDVENVNKDLVIGRNNGLQVHWNQGYITDMKQDIPYAFGTGAGPFFEQGVFDALDNFEDILVSDGSTNLYYFINDKNGELSIPYPNNITLPYSVYNFKIRQLTDKAEGYIQNNLDDRSDIIFVSKATKSDYDKLLAYQNNQNEFDLNLANLTTDRPSITDIEVADLDGDGYNDIVLVCENVACPSNIQTNVYKNAHGQYILSTPVWSSNYLESIFSCSTPTRITVADLNKDGLNDLVFVGIHIQGTISIMKAAVFINQNNSPSFLQEPDEIIDIAVTDNLPVISHAMLADIYGGAQTDGGGIALVVSYYIDINGGLNKEIHVKVLNSTSELKASPPPPPILQRLVYQSGGTWHPWIHLNKRGVRDFRRYDITKYKSGVFTTISTTEDDYIDYNECMDLTGEDNIMWNCYYYAKIVDFGYQESEASEYAYYTVCDPNCGACAPVCDGCQGDNSLPYQNQNNNNYPVKFTLSNFPNPFNSSTMIHFTLPNLSKVKLTIYNSLGQIVSELTNSYYEAGEHNIQFDGLNLASGIYYYRINSEGFTQTNKMLLLK